MILSWVVWIEEGLVLQHGAGDGEQSIGDGSQRAGMAVATLAESGVLGLADRVELYGDARPMVERIAEAAVCGETSDDDLAFSGALGDRRHATKASQGMVVSPLQGFEGLCEQRGENDPTDSGQGCEDRRVALLGGVARLGVSACGEALGEAVEAIMGLAQLPVDQGEPRRDGLDVGRGRVGGERRIWPC